MSVVCVCVMCREVTASVTHLTPFLYTAISDSSVGISTPDFPEFARVAGRGLRQPNIGDIGPICQKNTNAFNQALEAAKPGDTVLVPDGLSFHFTGGIQVSDVDHITIDIAGSMHFVHNQTVSIASDGM